MKRSKRDRTTMGGWTGCVALSAVTLVACGGSRTPASDVARAPLEAPRTTPGSLDATALLEDLPKKAMAAGAGPLSVLVSTPMVEGERAGAFVDIPKDLCLLAYARGSSSLEDLDLAAFTDEGNPVAVDEGPDPKPAVVVCPPHEPRVYVVAMAAGGEGIATIGAQLVPRERAADVGRITSAKGAVGGAPRSPEGWPGLEDKVRAHRAALGEGWDELRRVAVDADARVVTSVAFGIDENGCTDALLVPDTDVALLDAEVLDASGRVLGRAEGGAVGRSITICSPMALSGSIQIRPHVGRGLVAVILSKARASFAMASKPSVVWSAPTEPLASARANAERDLSKAGYGAALSSQTGQLVLGRRGMLSIDLGAKDECRRIDVVAGAPLALVDASLWSDRGALLARGDGTRGTTLFACGRGTARLDLGTSGRPGPYVAMVRAEPWKSPDFSAYPLAASRMMGQATSAPSGPSGLEALFEGDARAVRHVVLTSDREDVQNANIQPGTCLSWSLGTEGEGTGVEARMIDVVDGSELDRAHGEHAARLRGCAGTAPRTVRMEVHATSGKLDGIVGERVVPSR